MHQMKAGDEAEVYDSHTSHAPKRKSALSDSKRTTERGQSSESQSTTSGAGTVDTQRISGVVSKVTPTSVEFVCDDGGDVGAGWLLGSTSLRVDMR